MQEQAITGDADNKKDVLMSSTQHFFKREHAAYGEMVDEGRIERTATPQQYMAPATPSGSRAENYARDKEGASETYMSKEGPIFD